MKFLVILVSTTTLLFSNFYNSHTYKIDGLFRINSFIWDWKNEDNKHKDNKCMGIGGRIHFHYYYDDFSFLAGIYTSQNPGFFRESRENIKYLKDGKDTLNRYNVLKYNKYGLTTIAKAYIKYSKDNFNVIIGRFGFNSMFTAENDGKMIPNTFEGVLLYNNFNGFKIKFAYLDKQKLRDKEKFHDVITYKDSSGDKWTNNDDAGVHKGLNYQNFINFGKNPHHKLYITEISKNIFGIDSLISFAYVPGILKDSGLELKYKFYLYNWKIRLGSRYILQKDDGAGKIAGYTNLTGKIATGYKSSVANSIDSNIINAKVDFVFPYKKDFFRIAYSKVANKADIINPWRGFPTGGYTRLMGQYNWYANTKTTVFELDNFWKYGLKTELKYGIQNSDENKINVPADSEILNINIIKRVTKRSKMRFRFVNAKYKPNGSGKKDLSYKNYRLEYNYFF